MKHRRGGAPPPGRPPALLDRVLAACRDAFAVAADAEITGEANPGTADRPRFAAWRALGVNRLSIGVQSFADDELRWLGRTHTAAEAEAAFRAARTVGFANINLDLIFGLPGQAPPTWARTLARACALGPEHLSLAAPDGDAPEGEAGQVIAPDLPDVDFAVDAAAGKIHQAVAAPGPGCVSLQQGPQRQGPHQQNPQEGQEKITEAPHG
jgi:oxygen-independent coproporphyrinogen-3 oxidase